MCRGVCKSFSQFVLSITSLFLLMIGLALLGLAVYNYVETDGFLQQYIDIFYICIGVGGGLFLVSIIGLRGACVGHKRCALGIFAFFMIAAIAVQCYVLVELCLNRNQFTTFEGLYEEEQCQTLINTQTQLQIECQGPSGEWFSKFVNAECQPAPGAEYNPFSLEACVAKIEAGVSNPTDHNAAILSFCKCRSAVEMDIAKYLHPLRVGGLVVLGIEILNVICAMYLVCTWTTYKSEQEARLMAKNEGYKAYTRDSDSIAFVSAQGINTI